MAEKFTVIRSKNPYLVWIDDDTNQVQNAQGYLPFFSIAELQQLKSAIENTLEAYKDEGLTEEIIYQLNEDYRKQATENLRREKRYVAEPQPVFVYVMHDTANGYYKIGYSKNPKKRESTLQAEKPSIEIVRQYQGFISDEKYLHELFAEKRIRGEWFSLFVHDLLAIDEYFRGK